MAYLLIGLTVIAISAWGGLITQGGMQWYSGLALPSFTPPGSVIGMAWTVIYIMCAIAASLIWRNRNSITKVRVVFALLIVNGLLNLAWTYIFFGLHAMGLAVAEMVVLNLTNLLIIILCWQDQRSASYLFLPYFAWVSFATYLAFNIWILNI